MNKKLVKIKNFIFDLVQSDWFIVLNSALILLGWALNIWVPMLCVVSALNILPLFFDRRTKHLFILLMMFSFIMSTNRNELMPYAPMLAIVGAMLVGMIFNMIFFKRDLRPLLPKNIKGFHASLLALIVPFALAGVGSPSEKPLLTVAVLALIVILGVIYSFFTSAYSDTEERKDLPEYVLKILFASGLVVALEMIIFYIRVGDINQIVQAMMAKKVHLGWAGPNNMAPLLSISIPATLYFCLKKNFTTPLFAAIAMIEYALIFTTGCRGAILFTTLAMPAMLLYTIVKSENKLAFGVTISLLFIIAVVIVGYYGDIFANIITTILNKRLESSGREELYKLAIDTFKTWPILGAGWDHKTDLFYHSTFFQVLATMGLFGLIIFAIFYIWRYWTFFKMRKEPSTLALLAGMVLFEAYGFIDTNYFLPNFFTILLLMTFVVEINLPKNACRAFGGKDPVAHVVGFFRILLDRVKPVKATSDANENSTSNASNDSKTPENVESPAMTRNLETPASAKPADKAIPQSSEGENAEAQAPAESSSDDEDKSPKI